MTNSDEIDQLLCAAIHEAGHAVAFGKAGITVHYIQVWPSGDGAKGYCHADNEHIPDRLGYLAAILTGVEAQARWLQKYHGHSLGSARREIGTDGSDRRAFRAYSRGTGISETQARRKAESLVAWNFGRIERLATKLAKRGRLSSWSL